jgi:hypothetical protein
MIDLTGIHSEALSTDPYRWAHIDDLFGPSEATALAASYPDQGFKTLVGSDGEKGWEYEVRSLIHMGAGEPSHSETLSREWQELARDLVSPGYREAMGRLTGHDLSEAPIEVNVFHYGPGAWMGPHKDLKDKIVTHVLYFNAEWDAKSGGCLPGAVSTMWPPGEEPALHPYPPASS